MTTNPATIAYRHVGEWELRSQRQYQNPFSDVALDATFTSPPGKAFTVPGFFDGANTWRVRFSPNEAGRWTYETFSRPADPDLRQSGAFEFPFRVLA